MLPLLTFALVSSTAPDSAATEGRARVMEMIAAVGTMDDLRAKNDVEYTYVYERPDGKRDVSIERYRFAGEQSWAKFTHRDLTAPEHDGVLVQGFDGETAWVTLDGEPLHDDALVSRARFSRKTNFYWFAMMQKLADPGVIYRYEGTRTVDGVAYEVVTIGFEDGVGDATDAYVLYIHPETHLVDQFLFTVMAFGRKEPLLMQVEYDAFGGVKLPTRRKYTASDWEATIPQGAKWTLETMKELKFNNGFEEALFATP